MIDQIFFRRAITAASAVAALGLGAARVQAVDFQSSSGSVTGSWDTTLSYGQAWRVETPDCRLIATADGGCGRSPNIDDGNLNYGTDLFSRALKASTELSVNRGNFGATGSRYSLRGALWSAVGRICVR
jgi:Protein of unknown function (DUF1302)